MTPAICLKYSRGKSRIGTDETRLAKCSELDLLFYPLYFCVGLKISAIKIKL